jgi:putative spermidine/putrescine transport system substrate-binding protein
VIKPTIYAVTTKWSSEIRLPRFAPVTTGWKAIHALSVAAAVSTGGRHESDTMEEEMFVRKHVVAGAALALMATLAACGGSPDAGAAGSEDSLVIVDYGGESSKATRDFLAGPFEKETGIKTTVVDAPGTQEAQLRAQINAGKVEWDILNAVGLASSVTMGRAGLIEPLTDAEKDEFAAALGDNPDAVTDYGFTFANIGFIIACAEKVDNCPSTVQEFFDTENFPGSRTLPGIAPAQMTSILAQAAGVELPADLETLMQPLRDINSSVKVYWTSGDQIEQVLRQGEVDMGIVFSGRAYSLVDEGLNPTIHWAGVYDPGVTVRVKDAPHPEAAEKFMTWMVNNPEAQANWAEAMQNSVGSTKALDMLPDEVRSRFADYPENLANLGLQDIDWFVENQKEIEGAINQIIQGGGN